MQFLCIWNVFFLVFLALYLWQVDRQLFVYFYLLYVSDLEAFFRVEWKLSEKDLSTRSVYSWLAFLLPPSLPPWLIIDGSFTSFLILNLKLWFTFIFVPWILGANRAKVNESGKNTTSWQKKWDFFARFLWWCQRSWNWHFFAQRCHFKNEVQKSTI